MWKIIVFLFKVIIPIVLGIACIATIVWGVMKLLTQRDSRWIAVIIIAIIIGILTLFHPLIMAIISVIVVCSFLFENC